MDSLSLTWAVVDAIATDLGASEEARRKWRQTGRRVPWEWRLKIIDELNQRGVETRVDAFDALEPNPGRIAA